MDNVLIRTLSQDDAEIFWQLRLQALQGDPESFGASYEEAIDTPWQEVKARMNSSANTFVLGAFSPELVGIVGLFRQQGQKVKHKGTIWGMYVKPDYRGRGIARALMETAIRQAAGLPDIEQLNLTVGTFNTAACRLYQSLGFITYGCEIQGLRVSGKYVDEQLMALRFKTVSG